MNLWLVEQGRHWRNWDGWPKFTWLKVEIKYAGDQTHFSPRIPNSYTRMLQHYLDCIINDKEPLVSGEDGARAVEVMCAVFKSMQTNTWVELPLNEEVIPPHYRSLPREE